MEYAPFDGDGTAFAEQLQLSADGCRRNYWHTGTQILRFDAERANGVTSLRLDKHMLCEDMEALVRIFVTDDTIITETVAGDGAERTQLFDFAGQELFLDTDAKHLFARAEEAFFAHTFAFNPTPERICGLVRTKDGTLYVRFWAAGQYYLASAAEDGTVTELGVYDGDLSEYAW